MKNIILSAGISIVALVSGCAADGVDASESATQDVVTARCPANLSISVGKMRAFSFSEIEHKEGFYLHEDDKEMLSAPLRQIETMPGDKYIAFLNLVEAKDAECKYESGLSTSNVTAKFYTKSGKNILRVDSSDAQADGLSFYLTVEEYTETSVKLTYANAGIFYRDTNVEAAFSPRHIGRANEASVSVVVPQ